MIKSTKVFICFAIVSFIARVNVLSETNAWPPRLATFCNFEERQEQHLADKLAIPLPPEVAAFFQSAQRQDYPALSNKFAVLQAQIQRGFTNEQPAWRSFLQPMTEVEAACRIYHQSGQKYPEFFGNGISQSIPSESINFSGSEAGRILVMSMSVNGLRMQSFTTIAAGNFIDGWYMDYLQAINNGFIRLPTGKEITDIFIKYCDLHHAAYKKHPMENRLPPPGIPPSGIDESMDPRQVYAEIQDGQLVIDSINARLVKWTVDHNPGQEFYYEQDCSLLPLFIPYHFSARQIFLNPYLSPHGFIFKLHHDSVQELPAKDLDVNHEFWAKQVGTLLGDWLRPETSAPAVCAFVEATRVRKNLTDFQGDREFLTNNFAPEAFSKLRLAQADLYYWRAQRTAQVAASDRLWSEADFAFRQAYALAPACRETVSDYVNFLLDQHRVDDAILVVRMTLQLTPLDDSLHQSCANELQQLITNRN